jgi:hypothetical protein
MALKKGDALLSLLLNFTLEPATKKVQGNKVRLKPKLSHQLLVYAGDVTSGVKIKTSQRKHTKGRTQIAGV